MARKSKVAIGTWPTPGRTKRKKKSKMGKRRRKGNPRGIDTVPLPEKPVRKAWK